MYRLIKDVDDPCEYSIDGQKGSFVTEYVDRFAARATRVSPLGQPNNR